MGNWLGINGNFRQFVAAYFLGVPVDEVLDMDSRDDANTRFMWEDLVIYVVPDGEKESIHEEDRKICARRAYQDVYDAVGNTAYAFWADACASMVEAAIEEGGADIDNDEWTVLSKGYGDIKAERCCAYADDDPEWQLWLFKQFKYLNTEGMFDEWRVTMHDFMTRLKVEEVYFNENHEEWREFSIYLSRPIKTNWEV